MNAEHWIGLVTSTINSLKLLQMKELSRAPVIVELSIIADIIAPKSSIAP